MARFDVFESGSNLAPFLVDVQADILNDLASCVVIPLVPISKASQEADSRLKPHIVIKQQHYVLMTTDIAAIPRVSLGKRVLNIEAEYRHTVINALDFLFQGF